MRIIVMPPIKQEKNCDDIDILAGYIYIFKKYIDRRFFHKYNITTLKRGAWVIFS